MVHREWGGEFDYEFLKYLPTYCEQILIYKKERNSNRSLDMVERSSQNAELGGEKLDKTVEVKSE